MQRLLNRVPINSTLSHHNKKTHVNIQTHECQHAFKMLTCASEQSTCQHTGTSMPTCTLNLKMSIKSYVIIQPLFPDSVSSRPLSVRTVRSPLCLRSRARSVGRERLGGQLTQGYDGAGHAYSNKVGCLLSLSSAPGGNGLALGHAGLQLASRAGSEASTVMSARR